MGCTAWSRAGSTGAWGGMENLQEVVVGLEESFWGLRSLASPRRQSEEPEEPFWAESCFKGPCCFIRDLSFHELLPGPGAREGRPCSLMPSQPGFLQGQRRA